MATAPKNLPQVAHEGAKAEPAKTPRPDLQAIGNRLREVAEQLRHERERQLSGVPPARPAAAVGAPPSPDGGHRDSPDLALAREALGHAREEEARLRSRLEESERERKRLEDACVAAESRAASIAALYSAVARVHDVKDRAELLLAIEEILAALLGCEEFAVHELDRGARRLRPVHSVGLPLARVGEAELGAGVLGKAAADGKPQYGVGTGEVDSPRAVVPLSTPDGVVGTISLYRLLPQKRTLGVEDRELLEVLGRHAGLALAARGRRS